MPKGLPEDREVVIFPGEILGNPCDTPRPLRQHGVHEAAQAHHPQGRREAPLPVRLPQAAPLRHQRHPPPAAPPPAVPAGGPHFPPRRHRRGRHQERHDERAVLRGTLPRRTRHAGRADRRSHGAVQRHSGAGRRARSRKLLISGDNDPNFIRFSMVRGVSENLRIVMVEPQSAKGGIIAFTREPSFNQIGRASCRERV